MQVQHPVPIEPPAEAPEPAPRPLMLTKKVRAHSLALQRRAPSVIGNSQLAC